MTRHTRPRSPSLLPELTLHLVDEVIPLWRVLQEEAGDDDMIPPFWSVAWVGGQAVARYVLDHPAEIAGTSVLDFGAGSGVCAIAAMKAGAAHALAADLDPYSEAAVMLNARTNEVPVEFTGRDVLDEEPPDVDIILSADMCYEQPLAGRVLAWLRTAHTRGIRVLIGDPGRDYFSREGLVRVAEYDIPTSLELEGMLVRRTGVFTFSPA